MFLIGHIAFLRRANPDPKTASSYYDGEYLIIEGDLEYLYGVKTIAGYEGTEIRQFPLVGTDHYTIVRHELMPVEQIRRHAARLQKFAEERPLRAWCQTVYDRAEHLAEKLQRLVARLEAGKPTPPPVPIASWFTFTLTNT